MVKKRLKDVVERVGEAKDSWLNFLNKVPPQSGLVPIPGTPFFATPDEPADPFDCDRYPDSIYCGENPFTREFVNIEPAIVGDECNFGIQATPILGFIRLPPVQLVYRVNSEKCRRKPPPKLPIEPNDEFTPIYTFGNCLCKINFTYTSVGYENQIIRNGITDRAFFEPYSAFTESDYLLAWEPLYGLITRTKIGTLREQFGEYAAMNDPERRDEQVGIFLARHIKGNPAGLGETTEELIERYSRDEFINVEYESLKKKRTVGRGNAGGAVGFSFKDTKGFFRPIVITSIDKIWCPTETEDPIKPPPVPPQPKCNCNMTCCPSTTQNDQLLRMLIQKVDKLSKIVGVDEYPASLPASLISKDEGFLGNLIPNANTNIPNLTRLISWYVERFDEIMGQWEIPIEVKDADPTKPGDQPVGFKLPNMAEAIAEMFGLMLQTSINSETLINMNTRALLEGGQIKQQGFKNYMMTQAIADHMGFQYKDTKHKIPMLFKIGEEELDKLLQESTLEVTAPEHTDTSDLKTTFNDLLQAAAIIRAVHFRQFDPKQDVKQQLKNLINNLVASGDTMNKQQTDNAGKDDFDRFLEDAEVGFTNISGASDSTHPYGRNYSERPKIREIGTDTSESKP